MRRVLVTFLIATAIGFVGAPSVSQAYLRRYHGAICKPQNGSQTNSYNETFGMLNGGGSSAAFFCPIQSDDSQPHQLVWQAYVHGQKVNATGSDSVTACTKLWGATGFTCGFTSSVSAAGPWGIGAWLDGWTSGVDFPYFKVVLQPSSGVFGIFLVS